VLLVTASFVIQSAVVLLVLLSNRSVILCILCVLTNCKGMQRFSHVRRMLVPDSGPTRSFFSSLFSDHVMAIAFLKDIGLIRKVMPCDSCNREMTWCEYPKFLDGFVFSVPRKPTEIWVSVLLRGGIRGSGEAAAILEPQRCKFSAKPEESY
jgi:hypothetical protein